MPRRARAILAALCASVAALPYTWRAKPDPPRATFSLEPTISVNMAKRARASRQDRDDASNGRRREDGAKEKKKVHLFGRAPPVSSLTVDLYPRAERGFVPHVPQLGGEHEVLSTGTRIRMKAVLGRGTFGTVIGGEYKTTADEGKIHTIAVKRMLTARPEEVLNTALSECGAILDGVRGSLEVGVVPCYGIVVGPNITDKLLDSAVARLNTNEAHFARNVPVVVGSWSDNRSKGWNVALLLQLVEDFIDGNDFAFALFTPGMFAAPVSAVGPRFEARSAMHSALKKSGNLQHVPSAIVACVTRAARFLVEHDLWSRDLTADNFLFRTGFALNPFAPNNCLLIDFSYVVPLKHNRFTLAGCAYSYMHPMSVGIRQTDSASLHHGTDIFNLSVIATRIITGDEGTPVFRCTDPADHAAVMARMNGKLKTKAECKNKDERDSSFLFDIEALNLTAARLANLTERDLRGISRMAPEPCSEIAKLIGSSPRPDLKHMKMNFRHHADAFGWTVAGKAQLGPTPGLAQLAQLFQLTGAEYRDRDLNEFMSTYDDLLKTLDVGLDAVQAPTQQPNADIGAIIDGGRPMYESVVPVYV